MYMYMYVHEQYMMRFTLEKHTATVLNKGRYVHSLSVFIVYTHAGITILEYQYMSFHSINVDVDAHVHCKLYIHYKCTHITYTRG